MAESLTGVGSTSNALPLISGDSSSRSGKHRAHTRRGILDDLYLSQLIPTVLIVMIGIITIWSASLVIDDADFTSHIIGIVLGTVVAIVIWRFDVRLLEDMTLPLFIIACVLMILPRIPGLGYEVNGMEGWVQIGSLHFQPSEPAKIVVIFLMASACAKYNGKIENFSDYVKLCATLLIPLLLIMTLDLGTGLIIFVIGAAIIICSGAPSKWVAWTIVLIVAAAAFVIIESSIDGIPHILKTYQLNRLTVFLDPDSDTTDSGYNLLQAKIAVGSGGLFGKGIGNATQAGSGFLPEAHTDFVFALYAEEFGFVGCIVLLALYAWMILATIQLARHIDSLFCKLLLVGCASMWLFQVLENVGMCLGIMPITGIPLPFVSYGSSSMVTQLMAVGVVQSVWCHRAKAA